MDYTGTAFRNHNLECIGIFFFLSKQPSINKSIELPKGNNVGAIPAANIMVVRAITLRNQSLD